MRKLLTALILLYIPLLVSSQQRDITLDDLWKDYIFYPKSISGFNSMNDGEHYSTMEKIDDNQQIIKYKFSNGKKIRTIFESGGTS